MYEAAPLIRHSFSSIKGQHRRSLSRLPSGRGRITVQSAEKLHKKLQDVGGSEWNGLKGEVFGQEMTAFKMFLAGIVTSLPILHRTHDCNILLCSYGVQEGRISEKERLHLKRGLRDGHCLHLGHGSGILCAGAVHLFRWAFSFATQSSSTWQRSDHDHPRHQQHQPLEKILNR